ncbi:MAG: MaoC family dehydratase N-terminal domain-containing protein [Pseudomonadota bacterium]
MTTSTTPPQAPSDLAGLRDWIGRSETLHDAIAPHPVVALHATLDYPPAAAAAGTALPHLWHWLYFLPTYRHSELGEDGHPTRGGFLPPVPLPRRMWAGSQLQFHQPVRLGDAMQRTSTIADVTVKEGRTGRLVFVKVQHDLRRVGADQPAITEFHDIVYREAKRADDVDPAPAAAPTGAAWQREWLPDDVMLFRYSALTFNGHRIHYDRRYVTQVEGYPGLIVHGPLIATLLMDLLRREMPGADVAEFRFKAVRPTFDGVPMRVNGQPQADGKTIKLWAQDHAGWLTMDAVATLR